MSRKIISLLSLLVLTISALAITLNRSSVVSSAAATEHAGDASPDGVWQELDAASVSSSLLEGQMLPQAYRAARLNGDALQGILRQAPVELTARASVPQVVLSLPMPDGTFSRFRIEDSPVMEPALAAKYPEIKTYQARGIDDPRIFMRFDWSPRGLHALAYAGDQTILIHPLRWDDITTYISYYGRDYRATAEAFRCDMDELHIGARPELNRAAAPQTATGNQLRTYRIAIATTQEYTNAPALGGGTVAGTVASINTWLNGINLVYERELSVRLSLVNNTSAMFTAEPDGFTNGSTQTMAIQGMPILGTSIGLANYDIGHVLGTGQGGIALPGVVCSNMPYIGGGGPNAAVKGAGASLINPAGPVGNLPNLGVLLHELGHQFGSLHSFNVSIDTCGPNRSPTHAWEPGGGTTLMSYPGLCPGSDVAFVRDDLRFHNGSFTAMVNTINTTGTCVTPTPKANSIPTINAGADYTIPRNTPFTLTAVGGDADPEDVPNLTYVWEQVDAGGTNFGSPPDSDAGDPANTTRPIFRAFQPTAGASRTFPSPQFILNNANVPPATFMCGPGQNCLTAESLPNVTRTLNFRCTIRDQRGGVIDDGVVLSVNGGAGPFAVTSPNSAVTFNGNSQQTVTWDVANTNTSPVNVAEVRISLSADGGNTFPYVLAASTANDGTETIIVPNVTTAQARIKVEALANIFFDISDANLTIHSVAPNLNKLADFDGDGQADVSVFRPSDGVWYLQRSSAGFTSIQFGLSTDRIVPGDYDGDGKTDVAVWRPSNGSWYSLDSSNGALRYAVFGQNGDLPTPGDYDGDGKSDISVYRPANNNFYLLYSSDGSFHFQQWGAGGDQPVVGDYDGDGKSDFAIFRPSVGIFYILQSSNGVVRGQQFGQSGDKPLAGDFDGDGKTDIAVFRPSTGAWYSLNSSDNSVRGLGWGTNGDIAAAADYDGDGKWDVAVFRPATGTFYILQSTTNALRAAQFGTNGDVPVPSAYVP